MKLNRNSLNKMIVDSIRMDMKGYQLKSRGCSLYKKAGSYFIDMVIGVSGMKSEKIKIVGYVKPYMIDDIFWEVFHMPENSKEPMGLRANGAFKVDPLEVFSKAVEYGEVKHIQMIAKELLSECHEGILNVIAGFERFDDFLLFAGEGKENTLFDYDLVNMLLLIQDNRYEEAKTIAERQMLNKKYGRFQNEGKFIYEWIIEYCSLRIGL